MAITYTDTSLSMKLLDASMDVSKPPQPQNYVGVNKFKIEKIGSPKSGENTEVAKTWKRFRVLSGQNT